MPLVIPPPHTFLPPAQFYPYEEAPAPATAPASRLSFSDLQQSFRDVHEGRVDNSTFTNGILITLAILALIVLIIHLRQRKKTATAPDSLGSLGRELSRCVSFPLGTRLLLKWVARANGMPYPALLLSSALFDKCVGEWARQPTFAVAQGMGSEPSAAVAAGAVRLSAPGAI